MHRFLVVIENAGDNYSTYAPDLPGCVATGRTPEQARSRWNEALELHIEGLLEDGLEVASSSTPTD